MPSFIRLSIIGALVMAVVSTAADWVWSLGIPTHTPLWGAGHGAVLFMCLGGYLGWIEGKLGQGLLGGLGSGIVAGLSFYPLAPFLGYRAMFVSWILLWILLTFLYARLSGSTSSLVSLLVRGLLAAVISGIGFVAIFDLYRNWNPSQFNALVHLPRWFIAYVPGLLALLWNRPARR